MILTRRWLAGVWMAVTGGAVRQRRALYNRRYGLRVATFHGTPAVSMARFARIMTWAQGHFSIVSPSTAEDFGDVLAPLANRDRLLVTFDDGLESNFEAACWLAERKIRAVFFIVPSLVDRTVTEYLDYHAVQGVHAFAWPDKDLRGLSSAQVRDMAAMGHRIGAHNFAHRDLGQLTAPGDLIYEIDRALEAVEALTGSRCEDFAVGFGHPKNISKAAAQHLGQRIPRVYACVRGLNVGGLAPRFLLRDGCCLEHPFNFVKGSLKGGLDAHWSSQVQELRQLSGTLP